MQLLIILIELHTTGFIDPGPDEGMRMSAVQRAKFVISWAYILRYSVNIDLTITSI